MNNPAPMSYVTDQVRQLPPV